MSAIPTCCVTGRVAGDPNACGDCDPCGASRDVPDAVKRLIAERDEWANKYVEATERADEMLAAIQAYLAMARSVSKMKPLNQHAVRTCRQRMEAATGYSSRTGDSKP